MAVFSFDVGAHGRTSGAITRAADPIGVTLILAHGAGAPRTHPFMVDLGTRLARRGIDVVTFNFLYAEIGKKLPDRPEILEACWHAAIAAVRARGGIGRERLFIGGKSMGGRVATRIEAEVTGLVLFGYPLHPQGKPKVVRDEILGVKKPMLVLQGSRDALGTAAELKKYLKERPNARVHVVQKADHALAVGLDDAVSATVDFVSKKRVL